MTVISVPESDAELAPSITTTPDGSVAAFSENQFGEWTPNPDGCAAPTQNCDLNRSKMNDYSWPFAVAHTRILVFRPIAPIAMSCPLDSPAAPRAPVFAYGDI